MSAFYIARVTIKDGEKLQDYSSKAMPIMVSFGGKLLSKGDLQADKQGNKSHDFTVIMQFPDLSKLNEALNSDSYQAIVPIRQAAADVSISIYQ